MVPRWPSNFLSSDRLHIFFQAITILLFPLLHGRLALVLLALHQYRFRVEERIYIKMRISPMRMLCDRVFLPADFLILAGAVGVGLLPARMRAFKVFGILNEMTFLLGISFNKFGVRVRASWWSVARWELMNA